MKVRSGLPYWRVTAPESLRFAPLAGDLRCEVVVLGGGISGALVAYLLNREGVDTVLIDKAEFAAGSTAASTGLLQYEVDTPLTELISKVGQDHAVHAYRRGLRAIDELAELVLELDDPCGLTRRDSLYFASRFWHVHRLKREAQCRAQHGFDVQFVPQAKLADMTSIRARAAIYSSGDGQIDPYRFTKRLIEKAHAAGLRAFENSSITEVRDGWSEVVVANNAGRITASHIVFAAGYESSQFMGEEKGDLNSSYVVASDPLPEFTGWPRGCLIWETARPYFYARQTDDGRAIIGGEDTAFATDHQQDGLVERKVARLQNRFHDLFPTLSFEPAYAWAGTFDETADGLPFIGQLPKRPRAYFALGYGGNGITFSMIAARLISDLYRRRPNEDAAVFRFGR